MTVLTFTHAGRLLSSNYTFTPPPVGLDRTWFMPRSSRFQNHSFFNRVLPVVYERTLCSWLQWALFISFWGLVFFDSHYLSTAHLFNFGVSHTALLKITTSLSYHKFSFLILSSISFVSWKEKYGCSRSASHIYNKQQKCLFALLRLRSAFLLWPPYMLLQLELVCE